MTHLCQCGHAKSDHGDKDLRHPHFRTKPGDDMPIMIPTTNHDYCKVALCSCVHYKLNSVLPKGTDDRGTHAGKKGPL